MKITFSAFLLVVALLWPVQSPAAPSVSVTSTRQGPTPFISLVRFRVSDPAAVKFVRYQIAPKTGSATRPLGVRYSARYIGERGYFDASTNVINLPVFGLYAGRSNNVVLTVAFKDGTSQQRNITIQTPAYDGGTYSHPEIVQSRLPGTTLSYDFIMLKSHDQPTTPIVIDTDGEVRWIGTAHVASQPSGLYDNAFYLKSGSKLLRTEFDGTTRTLADYSSLGVTGFHHNIDPGRDGMILDADTTTQTESVNIEVDRAGNVLRSWNLGDIISAAMIAGGDDPTQFVKPAPIDWFHNNATTYRASDNSLIVSSRENFVIALDYDTGAIKWILGDPTKHWHDFASLRAFELELGFDTLPPIGQHAVSIVDDKLLLFDDGAASMYQMPPGETRTYSAPRKYDIDTANSTATEIYHYLADPSIYSPYCSSVYEDATDNYLIDYTLAGPLLYTEVIGLDGQGNKAFDYRYTLPADNICGTAWNSYVLHWEDIRF